ncbi:hypothetical protein [Acinetobacter pittii]|uniref:hypothetical protein n=1 Tax=Acinetobacter pittii TaxID=48296 RepID=UPI00300984D2
MKAVKKSLVAEWEIISMAEWLEGLGRDPTDQELIETYKGTFFPLYLTRRVDKKQTWSLSITTTLHGDDGTVSECEMEWKFNKPMSMNEVLNGAKHIKVQDGNFTKRWEGVTKQWLREMDKDYDDSFKAVKAVAVARCTAMVKQVNGAAKLLNSLIGHLEKVA